MPYGHVITTGQPPRTIQLQHHPADLKVIRISIRSRVNNLISGFQCTSTCFRYVLIDNNTVDAVLFFYRPSNVFCLFMRKT
jgi:hypothetical protein